MNKWLGVAFLTTGILAMTLSPMFVEGTPKNRDVTGSEAVSGKLADINTTTGQISVKNEDNVVTILQTNKKTQIRRGEQLVTLGNLNVDEQVMVQYRRNKQECIAQSIVVATD